MTLRVVLRVEAQDEFDHAFDWYEAQQPGLGADFADRVQETLDQIAINPHTHESVLEDVRRAVVRRFPYCVYYRVERARVLVLAIMHAKRNPTRWKKRL